LGGIGGDEAEKRDSTSIPGLNRNETKIVFVRGKPRGAEGPILK